MDDDLVFKNIPAEGFEPQTGLPDRFSNPTPSRIGAVSETSQDEIPEPTFESRLSNPSVRTGRGSTSFSDESLRLSNPTPSRRTEPTVEKFASKVPAVEPTVAEPFSRASNPTPTRRGAKPISPFDTAAPETQEFSASPVSTIWEELYSRVSNPTPTRRRGNMSAESVKDSAWFGVVTDVDISRASNSTPRRRGSETTAAPTIEPETSSLCFVPDETFSRASNPTPTRRGSISPITPDISPIIEEMPLLSFSSITDPYGAGLTEDSRSTNLMPTRRVFESDETPSDDDYNDNSRLSNITPSSRR